jgi:hypothetical protein
MTYECPKQGECGFGNETPWRCKHGAWVPSGTAGPSSGPVRVKVSREVAAKLLGLVNRQGTPLAENLWVRNIAPREAVKQSYREHEQKVAAARAKSRTTLLPPGPALVDPETGVYVSAADYWARNP